MKLFIDWNCKNQKIKAPDTKHLFQRRRLFFSRHFLCIQKMQPVFDKNILPYATFILPLNVA